MGELAIRNRTELVEQAFKLHLDGHSKREIGRRLSIDDKTAARYIDEYAAAQLDPTFTQQRKISMARLDKIITHAWEMLEDGDIRDSSLSRPQLLHQIIQAIKEQNKISGLHVNQLHISNSPATTLVEIVRDLYAAGDLDDEEVIEDAEVIED